MSYFFKYNNLIGLLIARYMIISTNINVSSEIVGVTNANKCFQKNVNEGIKAKSDIGVDETRSRFGYDLKQKNDNSLP